MNGDKIKPCYKAVFQNKNGVIEGTETTSGEKVLLEGLPTDYISIQKIADILNQNEVSVHHAKEVVRDILLSFL